MEALGDALNAHGAQHEHEYDFDAVTPILLDDFEGHLLLTGHHDDPERLAELEATYGVDTSLVFWDPTTGPDPPFPQTDTREFLAVSDPSHYNHPEDFARISAEMRGCIDGTLGFLDMELHAGHTVLVSCTAGVSRSPTLVLYCLIRHARHTRTDLSLDEYVWSLKQVRPCVAPDLCFLYLLDTYHRHQQACLQDGATPDTSPRDASI